MPRPPPRSRRTRGVDLRRVELWFHGPLAFLTLTEMKAGPILGAERWPGRHGCTRKRGYLVGSGNWDVIEAAASAGQGSSSRSWLRKRPAGAAGLRWAGH